MRRLRRLALGTRRAARRAALRRLQHVVRVRVRVRAGVEGQGQGQGQG